jgi:SH3 domain protein
MKRVAIGILGMAAMAVTQADPLYISDKLVVNVYAEADQESSKVATLDSGDAVESIEKMDAYTHVRLADNREGWIKSSYLTAQVPAVVRLKELEKERAASSPSASAAAATTQLSEELKRAKEQLAVLQTELAAAKQTASAPTASVAPPPPKRTEVEQVAREQVPSNQATNETSHFRWLAGVGLLCGTIGFALGYQMLARRIRRKYGSVRIY